MNIPDPRQPPPRATRKEWLGLAIIALPCMVYAMDLTVLNLALPAISAAFAPSAAQLLWIIDIYGFLVAGLLITMGTRGDRIGRRRLLLIGAAAFAVASVLAAFATSANMLIALRALLGIAGATLAPSTLSLIRNMFLDERERQFAVGLWIASYSVGSAVGPLVGGALLQALWWGAVFLPAVPVMALLLVLGPRLLPEFRDPHPGRVDPASVALSLAAVLLVIFGLKQMAEHGPSAPRLGLAVIGVGLGWAFVRRQRSLPYPLLDVGLFAQPAFRAVVAAYALSCLSMFGIYIFITQYLQLVQGLSPLHAGWAVLPWSLAFVAGSLGTPWLTRRATPPRVLVGALAVTAAGFALVVGAGGPHGLAVLVVAMVVMSLGMAPVFTIGNDLILTAAPPERAGAASAVSETSAEFSGALGIALMGSLGTAVYRHTLSEAMPAGLSAGASTAALATLGGALAVAQDLPEPAGRALAGAARAAFVNVLQLNAGLGAVLTLCALVLTRRLLRPPAPTPTQEAYQTGDAGLCARPGGAVCDSGAPRRADGAPDRR